MANQNPQNQLANLAHRFQLLSQTAHTLLADPAIQELNGWNRQTIEISLKNTLIVLGYDLEKILGTENEFEKLLALLDQFLGFLEEDSLESVVPKDKLVYFEEVLDQENLANQKLIVKIQQENEAYLRNLQRRIELKQGLGKALEEANQINPQEYQKASQQIVQELNLEPFEENLQRALESPALEKQAWEEINQTYHQAVDQSLGLAPTLKEYLYQQNLSLETAGQIITASTPEEKIALFQKATSPLTGEKLNVVKKNLEEISINAANLDSTANLNAVREQVYFTIGQKISQLNQEGLSPEQTLTVIETLSAKTHEFLIQNPAPSLSPIASPDIIFSSEEVIVSLTSPDISNTLAGNPVTLATVGEKTPNQKISQELKKGRSDNDWFGYEAEYSNAQTSQLLKQGHTPQGIEKMARLERRLGGRENLQRANRLQALATRLRNLQGQLPLKSAFIEKLALNRIKVFQSLGQIPSPSQLAFSKIGRWAMQTGLGKNLKSIALRFTSKTLQNLWGKVVSKGIGQTVIKVVSSIALKLGLNSLAAALTGGTSLIITVGIPLVFKAFKKTINFGKKFFSVLTLGVIPEKDIQLKKIFILIFVFIIVLPLLTSSAITGGAFMNTGKGLYFPGTVVPLEPSLDCGQTRHSAETMICEMISCVGNVITIGIMDSLANCIRTELNWPNWEAAADILRNHMLCEGCNGFLQCVGFVLAFEKTQGIDIPSQNACSYVLNPPAGFDEIAAKVTEEEGIPTCSGQPGDIAVWGDPACGAPPNHYGHVGIVVAVNGSTISVSAADGYTGIINTLDFTCGAGGGPTIFLRK